MNSKIKALISLNLLILSQLAGPAFAGPPSVDDFVGARASGQAYVCKATVIRWDYEANPNRVTENKTVVLPIWGCAYKRCSVSMQDWSLAGEDFGASAARDFNNSKLSVTFFGGDLTSTMNLSVEAPSFEFHFAEGRPTKSEKILQCRLDRKNKYFEGSLVPLPKDAVIEK